MCREVEPTERYAALDVARLVCLDVAHSCIEAKDIRGTDAALECVAAVVRLMNE